WCREAAPRGRRPAGDDREDAMTNEAKEPAATAPTGDAVEVGTVLEVDDVRVVRQGRALIDGIGLAVQAGEQWALLGPNGAGKSTLLGLCGAQTHPTTGTVHVLGHRLGRVDMRTLRTRIGHVDPRTRID